MISHGKTKGTSLDYSLHTKEAKQQLGKRLYCIRQALGKTQKEMGKILGVDQATICRWESGGWRRDGIPRASLVAYSIFQGCSIADLLDIHQHKSGVKDVSPFIARKLSKDEIIHCRLTLELFGILDPILQNSDINNNVNNLISEALHDFICAKYQSDDSNIIIISKIEGNYDTQHNKVRQVILNYTEAKNGLVVLC